MTVKQHHIPQQRPAIDLTRVPYFAPPKSAPLRPTVAVRPGASLTLQEASGLERVREAHHEVVVAPDYRVDRKPGFSDDSMHFGGLGLAAVMDVGAHPHRARARRINVVTVFAVTTIVAIGIVMITVAMTLHP